MFQGPRTRHPPELLLGRRSLAPPTDVLLDVLLLLPLPCLARLVALQRGLDQAANRDAARGFPSDQPLIELTDQWRWQRNRDAGGSRLWRFLHGLIVP